MCCKNTAVSRWHHDFSLLQLVYYGANERHSVLNGFHAAFEHACMPGETTCFSTDQKGMLSLASKCHSQFVYTVHARCFLLPLAVET